MGDGSPLAFLGREPLRGGENRQARVQQGGVQQQADEGVAFERLQVAALLDDAEGLGGADLAVDVAAFFLQDGAVGAEPFAGFDGDDVWGDRGVVAVLVVRGVAAVAEDDHVARGTVAPGAVFADGGFGGGFGGSAGFLHSSADGSGRGGSCGCSRRQFGPCRDRVTFGGGGGDGSC